MATAKFYPMSEDVQGLIHEVMERDSPYLLTLGLKYKFLGARKQSTIINVSKSNPITEYLTDEDTFIIIKVYEEAFEELEEDDKKLIIAHALNAIEFDSEHDRITITGNNGTSISEGIYLKYKEPSVLAVFKGQHVIERIVQAEKDTKTERQARKSSR